MTVYRQETSAPSGDTYVRSKGRDQMNSDLLVLQVGFERGTRSTLPCKNPVNAMETACCPLHQPACAMGLTD